MAKAAFWTTSDAKMRKLGEQTGLETPVVLAVNYVDLALAELNLPVPKLTREVYRLGTTTARLKLKGIDGDPHKQRSVWFNSMLHEEPYQGLTCKW